MPAVWQDRFARYLRQVLSLRESTELSVLPDLMPVLPVIDPASPELFWARGEARFIAQYAVAALAGAFSVFTIKVPSTAGHIVVVEKFGVRAPGAAMQFLWSFDTLSTGLVAPATKLDRRARHPSIPQSIFNAGTTLGLLSARYMTTSTTDDEFPTEVVLAPGSDFTVQGMTVNTGFNAFVVFRERSVASTPET